MAPQPKPQQPRYYNLYQDAYLMSHQERLEYSFKLAQQELTTKMKLLEFYEKRAADLRKANAGGSEFSNLITFYKLEHSVDKQTQDRLDRIARQIEDDYDISRFDIAGLGQAMKADMRAGSSADAAVNRALGQLGSAGSSELQKIIIGRAVLQQAETQAKILGKSFNRGTTRSNIASALGVDSNKMLLGDQDLKTAEFEARTKKIGSTVSAKDLRELKKKIEADNKSADLYTAKAEKIAESINDQYGEDIDLESIITRGREIYSNQFAPLTQDQKVRYAQQQQIAAMSPKAKLIYSGLSTVGDDDSRISQVVGGTGTGDVIDVATAIYNEKLRGGDTDLVKFARDMIEAKGITDKKKQQQILEDSFGLAFRSYKSQLPSETTRLEDDINASGVNNPDRADQRDPFISETKKQLIGELFDKGLDMSGFDELFGQRISTGGMSLPNALGKQEDTVDESKPESSVDTNVQEQSAPEVKSETPAEPVQEAVVPEPVVPTGPEFGKTYFKGNNPKSFGYQFIDADNVTFIKKDGSKVGKFGKDSAQYKEALEYFEESKEQ